MAETDQQLRSGTELGIYNAFSTESPFSINFRLTDRHGIDCQFTIRAVKQPDTIDDTLDLIDLRSKLIESMLAEGWQATSSGSRAAAPSADPNSPSCPHGLRVKKTGNSRRGPWTGYMCPLRKEDPNRCQPIFED